MPSYNSSNSVTILGDTYSQQQTVNYDTGVVAGPLLAPAKAGSLTTRTSVSVGTLTMASGHGITTAAVFDLFWTANGLSGARRGVVAGTVSVNSVPITGGTGDDLPDLNSAITAMIPHSESVVLDGANVIALVAKCDVPGFIAIYEADGTTLIVAIRIREAGSGAYIWTLASGAANPLGTSDVGIIKTSHSDEVNSRTPQCVFGYN